MMRSSHDEGNGQAVVTIEVSLAVGVDDRRLHGEIAEAEKDCRDALRRFPDSVVLLIAYGRVSLAAGRPADAVGSFAHARVLAPDDDGPLAWLIAAYCRLHERESWELLGVKALEDFPRSVRIRVALGRAYLEVFQYQEALSLLAAADSLPDADHVTASWYLVARAAVHGCGDLDVWAEAAISRHAYGASLIRYCQGRIYMEHERHIQAVECFETGLLANPVHPKTLIALPLALLGAGEPKKAARHAENAVSQLRNSPSARAVKACALVESGCYEQGAQEACTALEQAP